MKDQLKKALRTVGFSLHRLARGKVAGLDLGRDLSVVLGDGRSLVCVDVGAHVGKFVDLLENNLREPIVHAFEPAPESFELLRAHFGTRTNIHLVNAGLGNKSSVIDFNIYDNQTLNSALPLTRTGIGTLGQPRLLRSVPVPIVRLDGYSDENRLGIVDMLKIDTQGFELKVLEGAGHLLDGKVRFILLELNFVPLYEGQVWAHEVIGFLHERGYGLVDIYEKCRLDPLLGWCTALFAQRNSPEK